MYNSHLAKKKDMNAASNNSIPFEDPDISPLDSQVAIGMVLDLRREVERQEKFWRYLACASLISFSSFLFYAWSSGIEVFEDIQEEIQMQKELKDEINHLEFQLYRLSK